MIEARVDHFIRSILALEFDLATALRAHATFLILSPVLLPAVVAIPLDDLWIKISLLIDLEGLLARWARHLAFRLVLVECVATRAGPFDQMIQRARGPIVENLETPVAIRMRTCRLGCAFRF